MIEIETARLLLRRFQVNDVAAYHAAINSDPDVMKFMPGGLPRPIEHTRALIAEFQAQWDEGAFGGLAVIDKADGKLVGQCGLAYLTGSHEVEIFYALGQSAWGKGLATEAAGAMLRYGFETCQLPQIIGLAVIENAGSRRVLEKIGLKYQGVTTQYYNAELACYRLKRDDYTVPAPESNQSASSS